MRRIVKAFRRPPTGRMDDRNGGFPRLSDVVAHALRCPASPRRTLKAENLGKPSLWVSIIAPWYYLPSEASRFPTKRSGDGWRGSAPRSLNGFASRDRGLISGRFSKVKPLLALEPSASRFPTKRSGDGWRGSAPRSLNGFASRDRGLIRNGISMRCSHRLAERECIYGGRSIKMVRSWTFSYRPNAIRKQPLS